MNALIEMLTDCELTDAVYVEPCAGGPSAIFEKPRSRHEAVNDADGALSLFFRYARIHADALAAEITAALAARLRDAVFRRGDAVETIREFDAPDAFFFCDPPYIACGDTAYGAFSEKDMARLRDALADCRARWMLTCDDSPATRRVFGGFRSRRTRIKYSLAREKTGKESGELIIFSDSLAALFPGQTERLTETPPPENTPSPLPLFPSAD